MRSYLSVTIALFNFFFFYSKEKLWAQHLPGIQCIKRWLHKWPLGHHCQQRGQGHHSGKSTSEERTSLQHHRTLVSSRHGLWGMSQGQGHTVVNPHKVSPANSWLTRQITHPFTVGLTKYSLTSTDWDSILSLWLLQQHILSTPGPWRDPFPSLLLPF